MGARINGRQVGSGAAATHGLDRDLPAPGNTDALYFATDSGRMYHDDGTAWRVVDAATAKETLGGFSDTAYIGGGTGTGLGPVGGPGYTFALAFYVASQPGTGHGCLWSYSIGTAVRGWGFFGSANAANTLSLTLGYSATFDTIELPGATLTVGAHKLALAVLANGSAVHYAWDGVVQTPVASSVAGNYNAPNASSVHEIGRWNADGLAGGFAHLAELAAWNAVLADGDTSTPNTLAYLSNTPSDYRLHGDTSTRVWGWAARHRRHEAFAYPYGAQAVRMPVVLPGSLTMTSR